MEKSIIDIKAEELRQIITTLEEKIEKEKTEDSGPDTDAKKERMLYLTRKLNIFNQLLNKYYSMLQ